MRVLITSLLGLSLFSACGSTYNLIDAKVHNVDLPLAMSVDQVFDGLIRISHEMDYDIDIIDKDSGLLELNPVQMKATDLQRYCKFPALDEDGFPASSFIQYDTTRREDGLPPVTGSVALKALVKPGLNESSSILSLKTSWDATNGEKTAGCNSLGVWEQELVAKLREVLLTPPQMPATGSGG